MLFDPLARIVFFLTSPKLDLSERLASQPHCGRHLAVLLIGLHCWCLPTEVEADILFEVGSICLDQLTLVRRLYPYPSFFEQGCFGFDSELSEAA